MQISYDIRIEREFLYRVIDSEIRIPSDESRTVWIEEMIGSSDIDSHVFEYFEEAVSDTLFVVIERVRITPERYCASREKSCNILDDLVVFESSFGSCFDHEFADRKTHRKRKSSGRTHGQVVADTSRNIGSLDDDCPDVLSEIIVVN